MNKTLLTLVVALVFPVAALAHSLLMAVNSNDDGTVSIEAVFSTGGYAAGLEVRLEDADGKVLWRGKTDNDGKLTFQKQKVQYTIVLDGGKGHTAEEEGPM